MKEPGPCLTPCSVNRSLVDLIGPRTRESPAGEECMVPWRFMGRTFAARTARLGRARGASSDFLLCSSTALTSHSKLCPLPHAVFLQLPPPNGRKTLQLIAFPVFIKQKTTIHALCRQATLAYLIYRHFFLSARARDQIDYSTTIMLKVFSSLQ
ncbi:unnamed protein product [Ilex paraguariensis]|uniref:Uncharacterized protein n=1 Tax=Ilex paraguariensis TaxID=185542 RepID=A0ABC8UNA6_9AQUA